MTLFVSFSPKGKSPAAFKVSVFLLTHAYPRACGFCAALIIPSTKHGTPLAPNEERAPVRTLEEMSCGTNRRVSH